MISVSGLSYPGLPHHRGGNRKNLVPGNIEQLTFNNLVTQLSTNPIKFLHNNEEGYGNVLTDDDKRLLKIGFKTKGELEEIIRKGIKNEINTQGENHNLDIEKLVNCIISIINFKSTPFIGGEIYKAYAQLYIFGKEEFYGINEIVLRIENIISSQLRFMNNLVNRNAIQTPLSDKLNVVLNGKDVSYKVSSVLMGKYERIDVGLGPLNGFNTLIDALIGEKDDIRNFKAIRDGVPSFNLSDRGVYKKGEGTRKVNIVRLKDKGAYIEEEKKDLLNILEKELISELIYGEVLTFRLKDVLDDINELINKGIITTEEISVVVKIWIRKKLEKIVSGLNKDNINKLDPLDNGIIGWGILNGAFLEPMIRDLEKLSGRGRKFFTKYVSDKDYEKLIFNIIIKKS
nr:hypothetical protein [Candidatus Gracilibacteria bacterium]